MSQAVTNSRVNALSVKVISQAGRQVKGIGDATEAQDAVSLNQVTTVQAGLQSSIDSNASTAAATTQKVADDLSAFEVTETAPFGPGAGTYTVGLKLTGGGVNGTITLDARGRITAIQQAT